MASLCREPRSPCRCEVSGSLKGCPLAPGSSSRDLHLQALTFDSRIHVCYVYLGLANLFPRSKISSMLTVSIPIIATSVLLLCHPVVAVVVDPGDPQCDIHYGHPAYSDCLDLTYALYDGWPGTSGDRRQHLFGLRTFPIPDWAPPGAKNHRTWVPKFAKQGQATILFKGVLTEWRISVV